MPKVYLGCHRIVHHEAIHLTPWIALVYNAITLVSGRRDSL